MTDMSHYFETKMLPDEFETLFEDSLKALHSINSRKIFKIIFQYREKGYITTHDIEFKLKEVGEEMNKKEINAWLCSLQNSGMVEKSESRIKPSLVKYDDKYTYDGWKLTQKGERLATSILRLLFFEKEDEVNKLPELEELDKASRETIENLYYSSTLVKVLHESGGRMEYSVLRKTISEFTEAQLPDFLFKSEELPYFKAVAKPESIRGLISRLIGQKSRAEWDISLTEKGRRVAQRLER